MYKFFVPVAVSALLLGACSPAQYKLNPGVPKSQQEGYMRILGDLRWDQLTSARQWMDRFPLCLTDAFTGFSGGGEIFHSRHRVRNVFYIPNKKRIPHDQVYRVCKDFKVGGVHLTPNEVNFSENTGTQSKWMTSAATFGFLGDSKSRAFKSAIAQKYAFTTSGYCSKFTCWDLGDVDKAGSITAKPTPYTVSILDNVKVDKSDI